MGWTTEIRHFRQNTICWGPPVGLPTIHSATSVAGRKTVNDRLGTQLVDILIRLVADEMRRDERSSAFPPGSAPEGGRQKMPPRMDGPYPAIARKEKGPRNVFRGPFLTRFSLTRPRHRYRCRRRREISRTNPCQISCGTAHDEQLTERIP